MTPHQANGVTKNTIVFHCLYFSGGSMVKGWHLSRASTALSINACCFADGAGTSKRGGDATVPSRLKEMRIFILTLSSGPTHAGTLEHMPTRPRNCTVQS